MVGRTQTERDKNTQCSVRQIKLTQNLEQHSKTALTNSS